MGWWHYDPITKIAKWDARYQEIFGITGSERPNEEILRRIHPEDLPRIWAAVEAALDPVNPKRYSAEYRVLRDDGSLKWVEAHGIAHFEGTGVNRHAVSFVGTVADITDRKGAAEQSRTILESITDAFFSVDRAWRFVYINRQAEQVLGRSKENLLGKILWNVYPGLHGSEFEKVYRRAADEHISGSVISFYPDHNRWYEVHAYPAPNGISVYFRDATESKQAEAAIREIAERFERQSRLFERIASTTPDFIYIFDLDGRFLYANKRLLEVWGATAEQAVGKSLYELGYPEWHADMHMRELQQVKDTKQPLKGEVPFTGGSGISGVYEYIFTPVLGPDGEIEVIAGTTRDITDRKRAESERESSLASERAARAQAEHASRMKDEFLATLSHELRTPLNAILGWSQILSGGVKDPADLAEGLRTIERNARVQTQIIEDLLDMSRIISGKVRLDVQRLDLAAVVQAAIETLKPAAEAKGVRLQSVLDPNAGFISGDPNRLQQVFWNILTNAVKFTPRSGRVHLSLQRINSHLEVTVTDTGEGISPEFLPHVFDRFRQADASTTRRHGGLGLGLSIVKQLVELHGGSVRVTSPGLGQGSTFLITLPLMVLRPESPADSERRHPRALPDQDRISETLADIAGIRVLVVDDEPDARALVKRLLEDCRAEVTAAATAEEAIQSLQKLSFDVLISDIGMPNEDGYVLIKRVRSLGKTQGGNIPAIALTAYARPEDRVKAIVAGFNMHVAKPVEPIELITMVAGAAGRIRPS